MVSHPTFFSCDKISQDIHQRREDLFWPIVSGPDHLVPLFLVLPGREQHVTWHAVEKDTHLMIAGKKREAGGVGNKTSISCFFFFFFGGSKDLLK